MSFMYRPASELYPLVQSYLNYHMEVLKAGIRRLSVYL